jgi:hypothetical protein
LNINVVDTAWQNTLEGSKREAPFAINDAVLAHYAKAVLNGEKTIRGVGDEKTAFRGLNKGASLGILSSRNEKANATTRAELLPYA